MTQKIGRTATEVVADRVRYLRDRQGWSGRELAERCKAHGGAGDGLDRSVIANLESGRRRSVSIDEVLVLAAALNVAPVHLFVPVEETAVLVGDKVLGSGRVREWVRGNYPLPSQDKTRYRGEVPEREWEAFESKGRPPASEEELRAFLEGSGPDAEEPAAEPELEEDPPEETGAGEPGRWLTFVQTRAGSSRVYAFDSADGTVYVGQNPRWLPLCEFSKETKREDMKVVPPAKVPAGIRYMLEERGL